MKVGFTGTRNGMTHSQKKRLRQALHYRWRRLGNVVELEFHCGMCVGADTEAAIIAKRAGYRLVGHPGGNGEMTNSRSVTYDEIRKSRPYLERNRNIVSEVEVMFAAPKEYREVVRSGTWATIRYAKKLNCPLTILLPTLTDVSKDYIEIDRKARRGISHGNRS